MLDPSLDEPVLTLVAHAVIVAAKASTGNRASAACLVRRATASLLVTVSVECSAYCHLGDWVHSTRVLQSFGVHESCVTGDVQRQNVQSFGLNHSFDSPTAPVWRRSVNKLATRAV